MGCGEEPAQQAEAWHTIQLAVEAFDDPMAVSVQDREVGGEERWQTIGVVRNLRLIVVAHSIRDSSGE
jgi:uncharacterized DUF497 family protein